MDIIIFSTQSNVGCIKFLRNRWPTIFFSNCRRQHIWNINRVNRHRIQSASGNPAPDATYWVVVYDASGGAGAQELTISKYFAPYGLLVFDSSSASETIAIINWDSNEYRNPTQFECDSTLDLNLTNVGVTGVTANGEIIGDIVSPLIEGDKNEYAVIDYKLLRGTAFTVAQIIKSQLSMTV